jgi:hypothetical protein
MDKASVLRRALETGRSPADVIRDFLWGDYTRDQLLMPFHIAAVRNCEGTAELLLAHDRWMNPDMHWGLLKERKGQKPDIRKFQCWLACRLDKQGRPLESLFVSPSQQSGGWWRFAYLHSKPLPAGTVDEGWHGTRAEYLLPIFHEGDLQDSTKERGRVMQGAEGVYMHRPTEKYLLWQYAPFVELFLDGTWWRFMLECSYLSDKKEKLHTGKSHQVCCKAEFVTVVALWVRVIAIYPVEALRSFVNKRAVALATFHSLNMGLLVKG